MSKQQQHTAEFWVVVKAKFYGSADNRHVLDLDTTPRVTKKKPATIMRDECAIKMEVTVPDAVFLRPSLAVHVDIPEEAALTGTPVATVADLSDETVDLDG